MNGDDGDASFVTLADSSSSATTAATLANPVTSPQTLSIPESPSASPGASRRYKTRSSLGTVVSPSDSVVTANELQHHQPSPSSPTTNRQQDTLPAQTGNSPLVRHRGSRDFQTAPIVVGTSSPADASVPESPALVPRRRSSRHSSQDLSLSSPVAAMTPLSDTAESTTDGVTLVSTFASPQPGLAFVEKSRRTARRFQRTLSESQAVVQVFVREWLWVGLLIFGGCCSNVFTLEMIVREIPQCTGLVTFFQFLIVSVEGLYLGGFLVVQRKGVHPSLRGYIPKEVLGNQSLLSLPFKLSLKPRVIPLYHWFVMVTLFWALSIMNNAALNYKVDMPLHILFRSGGLMVNMFMGYTLMKKTYNVDQVISVCLVTLGVILCTYTSSMSMGTSGEEHSSFSDWLTGIGLLTCAMFISGLLGLYQEQTYRKYGKQWREGLFYTHFLGMPFFLFMARDLLTQAVQVHRTPYLAVSDVFQRLPILSLFAPLIPSFIALPRQWIYIFANALTQYVCISGVHRLTAIATSLTVNLVLTCRKFVSLLLSIYLFSNHFERGHYVGSALVFLGTFWYCFAVTSYSMAPAGGGSASSAATRKRTKSSRTLTTASTSPGGGIVGDSSATTGTVPLKKTSARRRGQLQS